MKNKHILLNLLSLPVWILYYLLTISDKELFMTIIDFNVLILIISAFTIYNLFAKSFIELIIRNLVLTVSTTLGCYVSGLLYLELCYHMSDEYYAVTAFTMDTALFGLAFLLITCAIKLVVQLINRKIRKSDFN